MLNVRMKNGAAFLSTRPRSRPAGRNAIFYCYICPRKNSLNPYAMKPVKTTLRRIGLLLALGAGLGAAAQTTLQNAQGTVRAQLDSAGRLAGGRQLPGRAPGRCRPRGAAGGLRRDGLRTHGGGDARDRGLRGRTALSTAAAGGREPHTRGTALTAARGGGIRKASGGIPASMCRNPPDAYGRRGPKAGALPGGYTLGREWPLILR